MKDTMKHLPNNCTFGIVTEEYEIHVRDLIGTTPPQITKKIFRNNAEMPCAGKRTGHYDDFDLQKHIVPILSPQEDAKIIKKITEDCIGGYNPKNVNSKFDSLHVFGVPTVRDPSKTMGKFKSLADKTV
jgi:hypothetical protein